MHNKQKSQNSRSHNISRAATAAPGIIFVLALILISTQPAQTQTYRVIYNFTGGADGTFGESLIADRRGNLYGTTWEGGGSGFGAVFKFSSDSLSVLYNFTDGGYGVPPFPAHQVMVGPDGSLYGTALYGGLGWGTVFNLRPQATVCRAAPCSWAETVLYRFTGGSDGANPIGPPVFDRSGNIFGATYAGGSAGVGAVYELTPANRNWTETVLHSFAGDDGLNPLGGVLFDGAGDLYGTTYAGGGVFELTPSGSGWNYSIIYYFGLDGLYFPFGNLTFDQSGNLYGTTWEGGPGNGGIYQLSPSNSGWNFNILYSFTGNYPFVDAANLVTDNAGNLYGAEFYVGAYGKGSVFKLAPGLGGWTYTSLHDFCSDGNQCTEGAYPASLVIDPAGNLYGTTFGGGAYGLGVIWEITP